MARKGQVRRHIMLTVVVIGRTSRISSSVVVVPCTTERALTLANVLGSCWTLDRFCVSRQSYAYFNTLNIHSAFFLQFGFASIRGCAGLSVVVLFRVVFYTTCVLICCITHLALYLWFLGQVHAPQLVLPFHFI